MRSWVDGRFGDLADFLLRHWDAARAPLPPKPSPLAEPPVSADLLDLLRWLGVALIGAGETTNRVQSMLDELAHRYGAQGVHFFVLPTGVFVRIQDANGSAVDILSASVDTLRLDQIAALYRLLDRVKAELPPPTEVTRSLQGIFDSEPRNPVLLTMLGQVVLTVGLGLMLNPAAHALVGYCVLGGLVGVLVWLAHRIPLLSLALPVTAAALVSWVAFRFPAQLSGGHPSQLLIPAVATMLPGAMLTNGTIELATGSMVAGASRLIYGMNVLLLLSFGLLIGLEGLGRHPVPESSGVDQLGWWAPFLGVLLIGIGHSWRASAPPKSLGWLLIVLYVTYAAQALGGHFSGQVLGAFLGGLIAVPAAYLVQRRKNAPPSQVAFLPAFWMLVPGGIGLTGVSDLIGQSDPNGLHVIVSALLTVLSIALGVLVGSGLVGDQRPRISTLLDTFLPAGRS
ncbi:threonine/serine exporter ThrE family protein [Nocardia sp. XZ_19_385]|uniref:threonine/serine ThrE exporter family protein n=1 Tax=Nocardia sp. XZ_19_385 TaxID=2769488 RepID=UPI00188F1405|nr:threonine/serine exporter family protein [Nocardia sp. XZ_19_385]